MRYAAGSGGRARVFEAALILPNSFDAALICKLAKIPIRIGYSRDGRGILLTHPIARPRDGEIPAHERFYYLELLRRAQWIDSLPEDGAPIHLVQATLGHSSVVTTSRYLHARPDDSSARFLPDSIPRLSLARETQQLRAVFPANLTENLRF